MIYKRGQTLAPINNLTGHSVIVKIVDIPERRKGMYEGEWGLASQMVAILTDFGNIVTLLNTEIDMEYVVTGFEKDVVGRTKRQIYNLYKFLTDYIGGVYD